MNVFALHAKFMFLISLFAFNVFNVQANFLSFDITRYSVRSFSWQTFQTETEWKV
jgi:hypothetical protein